MFISMSFIRYHSLNLNPSNGMQLYKILHCNGKENEKEKCVNEKKTHTKLENVQ